jgi:hypothetical protein
MLDAKREEYVPPVSHASAPNARPLPAHIAPFFPSLCRTRPSHSRSSSPQPTSRTSSRCAPPPALRLPSCAHRTPPGQASPAPSFPQHTRATTLPHLPLPTGCQVLACKKNLPAQALWRWLRELDPSTSHTDPLPPHLYRPSSVGFVRRSAPPYARRWSLPTGSSFRSTLGTGTSRQPQPQPRSPQPWPLGRPSMSRWAGGSILRVPPAPPSTVVFSPPPPWYQAISDGATVDESLGRCVTPRVPPLVLWSRASTSRCAGAPQWVSPPVS